MNRLDNLMAVVGNSPVLITCKGCGQKIDFDEMLHATDHHHVVISHRQPKRHRQDVCPMCLYVIQDRVEKAQYGG